MSPRTQKTNQTHASRYFTQAFRYVPTMLNWSFSVCKTSWKRKGKCCAAKHQAFSCVDGLLLLGPSTAKLTHFITQNTSFQALAPDKNIPAAFYTKAFLHRPLHPIHDLFLPTARKRVPSFLEKLATLLVTGLLLLDPSS